MTLSYSDVLEIEKRTDLICCLFPENTLRKNYFISACKYIDSSVNLCDINTSCEYGGIIGIGDSCLDYFFKGSKLLRLHAILHDAHGFMKCEYGTGPGYVYAFPFPVSNCLLGHLSGLLFCIRLKIFRNSVYRAIHC